MKLRTAQWLMLATCVALLVVVAFGDPKLGCGFALGMLGASAWQWVGVLRGAAMSAITWQRPQSPKFSRFCAVTRYEGGASISACGGRWETSSTYVLIGVDVGKLECPACRDALAEVPIAKAPRCDCGAPTDDSHSGACQLTRLAVALRELRDAPAIRTAELHTAPRDGVLFEAFDTSDAERDS